MFLNLYDMNQTLATHYVFYLKNPLYQEKTVAIFIKTQVLYQYVRGKLDKSDVFFHDTNGVGLKFIWEDVFLR